MTEKQLMILESSIPKTLTIRPVNIKAVRESYCSVGVEALVEITIKATSRHFKNAFYELVSTSG